MSVHADLLPRYQQLRQAGLQLNSRLVKSLSQSALGEGGRKLNLLEGNVLKLGAEDEIAVLMDYCIHDVRRHGANAIARYIGSSPPSEGSDEWVLLHALRDSRFSVFAIEAVEPGVGVQVRDLLRDANAFLVDIGFGTTAQAGMVFAIRVMVADGIGMTTGAALPIGKLSKADRTELIDDIRQMFAGIDFNNMAPEEATDFTGTVLRTCLADGAGERVQYLSVADKPPSRRGRRKKN